MQWPEVVLGLGWRVAGTWQHTKCCQVASRLSKLCFFVMKWLLQSGQRVSCHPPAAQAGLGVHARRRASSAGQPEATRRCDIGWHHVGLPCVSSFVSHTRAVHAIGGVLAQAATLACQTRVFLRIFTWDGEIRVGKFHTVTVELQQFELTHPAHVLPVCCVEFLIAWPIHTRV